MNRDDWPPCSAAEMMKITEIRLKNYCQFDNFCLSLLHPKTQQPLDKICFIGANGTGKSTILSLIANYLSTQNPIPLAPSSVSEKTLIGLHVQSESENGYIVFTGHPIFMPYGGNVFYIPQSSVETDLWKRMWAQESDIPELFRDPSNITLLHEFREHFQSIQAKIALLPNGSDLVIYAPPDGSSQVQNIPQTNVSNALGLFATMPAYHRVSYEDVAGFWNVLIYQIKKREAEKLAFLEAPEIQNKAVGKVRHLFDAAHPEILTELAKQWNLILERAGLEFDVEHAKIPVQLDENLLAYIRSRRFPDRQIPYSQLSTGIRNLIFRLGHIYSLYFNRKIDRGFLLIDEPELSLFPDLLYDIIDRYLAITQNTQMFIATHSPIIAGQFEPYERIILKFDDAGFVTPEVGISPAGDDPNDLLVNDFGVRSLYGHQGIEQWDRFLELRQLIHDASDAAQKKTWLDEYLKIGNAYNFAPDEISR
jgi:energy-coupling factor transporter ATP-binding protein EcfA2